jgi:hypothetical protein
VSTASFSTSPISLLPIIGNLFHHRVTETQRKTKTGKAQKNLKLEVAFLCVSVSLW